MTVTFYRVLVPIEVVVAFAIPTAHLLFGAAQVISFAAGRLTSVESEVVPLLILVSSPVSFGVLGLWAVVRLSIPASRRAKVGGDRWFILASAAVGVCAWVVSFGGPPGAESTFARHTAFWGPIVVTLQLLIQTWPPQRTRET